MLFFSLFSTPYSNTLIRKIKRPDVVVLVDFPDVGILLPCALLISRQSGAQSFHAALDGRHQPALLRVFLDQLVSEPTQKINQTIHNDTVSTQVVMNHTTYNISLSQMMAMLFKFAQQSFATYPSIHHVIIPLYMNSRIADSRFQNRRHLNMKKNLSSPANER